MNSVLKSLENWSSFKKIYEKLYLFSILNKLENLTKNIMRIGMSDDYEYEGSDQLMDTSDQQIDDSIDSFDNTNRVYLRDLFKLPLYIFDGFYESHDQFIALNTEDGIKLLHIYHQNKSIDKIKDNKENQTIGSIGTKQLLYKRLFYDLNSGWIYNYESNGIYKKFKKL